MVLMLAASPSQVWASFVWGLQRGDPRTWLILAVILLAGALLLFRRPRG
jgi:hypothetical protein